MRNARYDDTKTNPALLDHHHDVGSYWSFNIEVALGSRRK